MKLKFTKTVLLDIGKIMIYILILLFAACGCDSSSHPSSHVLQKAGICVFKDLGERYDLNMIRCFSGKRRVVSRVVTDYFHNAEVDVMTARYLLHTALDEYVEKISKDIEVKPFLRNGSIASENLECTIFFKKGLSDKKAISSVSLLGGVVRYNQIDLEDGVSKKILEEKYK